VDTKRIPPAGDPFTSAPHHDDQDRPHACLEGWVFITYEDEHGEEREASYRSRRCNVDPAPSEVTERDPDDDLTAIVEHHKEVARRRGWLTGDINQTDAWFRD
jgi:hypothetical protein